MQSIALDRTRAFYDLTKPGITRMVLVTTAAGFYLATRGSVDFLLLINTLLGTALAASGTNALNQWAERDLDSRMKRTANRPLPSGRLDSRQAFLFAWGISMAGLAYLIAYVNLATAIVVAVSLSSYVFIYTPLKTKTWISTLIGAVPGALPILAGWTASGQPVTPAAWALFAIMFVWQMPHFYALAWIYREDYGRAGFQMLTVVDATGARAARHSLLFTAMLIPISVLPTVFGVAGNVYLVGAVLMGIAFLVLTTGMLRQPSERVAWRIFTGSIVYLPLLLALMVLDKP
ncbi:MAG TPA: heme o synthase [Longimicrobiales bacterium]|nr:heme o synthase [Longimicrobiales bacterium]